MPAGTQGMQKISKVIKLRYRRRNAFSLVELMLAMLIMAIAGGVAVVLFSNFVTFFARDDDYTLAKRRATDALLQLEGPILNAGLGIPPKSLFSKTFVLKGPALNYSVGFGHWGEAISIVSNELRVVYSQPSGAHLLSYENKNGLIAPVTEIRLNKTMNSSEVDAMQGILTGVPNTKWVTFPGQSFPMPASFGTGPNKDTLWMWHVAGRDYEASLSRDETPRVFSELLFVKGLRVNLVGGAANDLKIETVDRVTTPSGGSNPTYAGEITHIPGVLRISFDIDSDRTGVGIALLTRGETRDPARRRTQNADLVARWGLTGDEQEYILEETRAYWRARNVEQ